MALKRTSKYFDGTAPSGKKIKDLLPEILAGISADSEGLKSQISQEWACLLGEQMAPLTEVVFFVDQVLTVKVKSATLYSLLHQREKPRLLKQLQKKFSIRNIVFRVG